MKFESVVLILFLLLIYFPIDVSDGTSATGNVIDGKPFCAPEPSSHEYPMLSAGLNFSIPSNMVLFDTAGATVIRMANNTVDKIKTLSADNAAHFNSDPFSSSALLLGTGLVGLIGISRKS